MDSVAEKIKNDVKAERSEHEKGDDSKKQEPKDEGLIWRGSSAKRSRYRLSLLRNEDLKNHLNSLHVDLTPINSGSIRTFQLTDANEVILHDDESESDSDTGEERNIFGRVVVGARSGICDCIGAHRKAWKIIFLITILVLYTTYLIVAIYYAVKYKHKNIQSFEWCNGAGILVIISALLYWSLLYYFVLKPCLAKTIMSKICVPVQTTFGCINQPIFSCIMGVLIFGALLAIVVIDAWDQPRRLTSVGGIVLILTLGLLVSKHPTRVKWSLVLWGIGLQFLFGFILLKWKGGREAFDCISQKAKRFLDFTDKGAELVYGPLVTGVTDKTGVMLLVPIFAFKALPVVFFLSFIIAILYHYGVMMWVITLVGWFLQITIGTTAAESMNAAANIFVGMIEAPILIKPFLNDMTKSELCAVMAAGFATIAGTVLGAFINFGITPSYLLSASIMAAPASLAMSKLIYPETRISKTTAAHLQSISWRAEGNVLDAAAQGATQGFMLIGTIIANVIAFLSFVAFLNTMINWFGSLVGLDVLSFEYIMAKVFVPIAYIIGIDSEETEDVAILLGIKTVVNEFVAYQRLASPSMAHLSCRSRAIATYALCSFSNFSSIGIALGGLGVMTPKRQKDLAQVVAFSFFAGSLCGLLNACIAGILLDVPGYSSGLVINGTFVIVC